MTRVAAFTLALLIIAAIGYTFVVAYGLVGLIPAAAITLLLVMG